MRTPWLKRGKLRGEKRTGSVSGIFNVDLCFIPLLKSSAGVCCFETVAPQRGNLEQKSKKQKQKQGDNKTPTLMEEMTGKKAGEVATGRINSLAKQNCS